MSFLERVRELPALGLGVSTEFGAASRQGSLDMNALLYREPSWASFLEVGVETAKGLDAQALAWAASGLPTTFHFLDLNLDHPEDFDPRWMEETQALLDLLKPAWICGDAGLWHFGPRDRGHMLLLPPILCEQTAQEMAEGIIRMREYSGLEVIPENPPGHVFPGDMHLLDFYARLCDLADTGLLLDCAHLAIYQRIHGAEPLDGLDGFPLDRVVELHVAGGTERERSGFRFVEDDHNPRVLPDTWEILEYVVPRLPNLKAVCFECERNPLDACVAGFERIAGILETGVLAGRGDKA